MTCTQTIQVVDSTPPSITCAGDKTIECDEAIVWDIPSVSDNCDNSPTLSYVESESLDACGEGTLTRTWTATDCAGNNSSCTQIINVVDNTAPKCVYTGPVPADFSCEGEVPDLTGFVVKSDNCSAEEDITIEQSSVIEGTTVTVTFTVTDECGNSSTCEFMFGCTPPDVGCAYTPGYWKNHPVCESTITCGINVNEALNNYDGSSNPWHILARAYTAAYLNEHCGDGSWDCISGAISPARCHPFQGPGLRPGRAAGILPEQQPKQRGVPLSHHYR